MLLFVFIDRIISHNVKGLFMCTLYELLFMVACLFLMFRLMHVVLNLLCTSEEHWKIS